MAIEKLDITPLRLEDWGLLEYQAAFERQQQLVKEHHQGDGKDTLVFVEHPAIVTLGRRAGDDDLRGSQADFGTAQVDLQRINRGGLATAHEPGQLVIYPIIRLQRQDLRWYADTLLKTVIAVLAEYELQGSLKDGEPGVWVNGRKICSFGIAVKKWVSSHGLGFNINNDLKTFDLIVPCGRPAETVTSVARELGRSLPMAEVKEKFLQHFLTAFAYQLKP